MMRTLGIHVSGLLSIATIALFTTSCEQPRIDCTTGHGGFAVKYTLKPGSKQGDGACDTLKGDTIGFEKYNPSLPGDRDHQDLGKATLAVRAQRLGDLAKAAADAMVKDDAHSLDAQGSFASIAPDDKDVCTVPTLSPAEQKLRKFGQQEATDMKYVWSNLRFYVTPSYPGTQVVGDLTYTENGCTASYSVLGLWPAVSCEQTMLDDKGNAVGTGKPDPGKCDPEADPAAGRPTGSGINPDFKSRVVCDPELLLCVLTGPPDELR